MGAGDYELTVRQVCEALGDLVGPDAIRGWVTTGKIPSAYYWRSPSRRLYFKRKVIAWLLAGGDHLAEPSSPAPRPKPVKVKPVRWDRAS